MKKSEIQDPFRKAREETGYGQINDQNDPVTMVLRLKDLRRAAKDWETFQSEAEPGRIVVPSEVDISDARQIPFEVDPPMHKEYRNILEAWFKRPDETDYREKLELLIKELVDEALTCDSIEVVKDFSLRLQCKALTLLLNMPLEESETWINWGEYMFRSEGSLVDGDKAGMLYDYIESQIDRAIQNPGKDLFSVLLDSEVQGRKLTREEVKGVMILSFAGGRDTIIHAVTNTLAYLAEHQDSFEKLRSQPEIRSQAVEEFIRYFSPLTHMGRVATKDAQVCEHAVKADSRISLCYASANRDASTFENPNEIDIERTMNPHVGFGFGIHKCLGATHARQVLKSLLSVLAKTVGSIEILDYKESIEDWEQFQRKIGYDHIRMKMIPKS